MERRHPIYIALIAFICVSFQAKSQEFRSINGYGNNLENPYWGMAQGDILRLSPANYTDGISAINDDTKPNPRVVSNHVFDQSQSILDSYSLSDFVWVFGQFIDHDISAVANSENEPPLEIEVPFDDEVFIPGQVIRMSRSLPVEGSGITTERNYANEITAFIDGSAIYGSDAERANFLRSFQDGKLRVSKGNLLPWNTVTGEYNDPKDPSAVFMVDDTHSGTKLFVAGDVRANENPLLVAMHTLFVREHNRICDELILENPAWSDEIIYQIARKKVGAIFQAIVYNEWLPAMGIELPEYKGYKPNVNPNITNMFSAAAFRVGHTLINSNIIRMDNEGVELPLGSMTLKDAFFNPVSVVFAGGIEPFLKGMAQQVQQEMDCKVVDDVRNFLFGVPGAGGLDLAAININRGRERGLIDYNTLREWYGKPLFNSFEDLTSSPEEAESLEAVYGSIDQLDAWVGLLAEDHIDGAIFGELLMLILEEQFSNIRDGDRFFYLNDDFFSEAEKLEISETSLHDVVMRNCLLSVMQKDVFSAMPHSVIPNGPEIPKLQLESALYPNPVDEYTTLKVYSEIQGAVTLRIMNNSGQEVMQVTSELIRGENFIQLYLDDQRFQRGYYNLLIESEDAYNIVKLIKN